MLAGKRIILGVTGGIAAYKAAYLLREFQKAGADVRVTMTPSATRFIGTETFTALSRHEVAVDVFNDEDPGDSWTKHIHWGDWADIFVIAPCTANTLSKIVQG
jgi:phosphopantothenoylcysteine decarboxylase/phosphopantothenate--cysteine ligase